MPVFSKTSVTFFQNLLARYDTGNLIINGGYDITGYVEANAGTLQINSAMGGGVRLGTSAVGTLTGPGGTAGKDETVGGFRLWQSTLNINLTGTLNLWDIQAQEGTGQPATINHSSGDLNVTRDVRIGHWSSATSKYNMSGGSLNLPDTVTNPTDEGQANLFLGIDGTGEFNQTGGTVNTTSLVLDGRGDTAGDDIYRLNGGRLNMGKWGIRSGNAGTTKRMELGGGILGASADWTTALPLVLTGTNGNVTINTLDSVDNTTPRSITLSGNLSGTGGFTKTGAGTLTISGAAGTFQGTGLVNGGTLHVVGNAAAAGTLATATGGILRPGTLTATGTATSANLTLGGGSVDFRIGTSADKLTATGTFNVDAPTAIRSIPVTAVTGPFPRVFDVIDYTGTIGGTAGFAGLNLVSTNPHLAGELVNDETNTVVQVKINSADTVIWKGNANGNWDVNATSNWVLGSDGTTTSKYYDFDVVKFDDLGITTPVVTLIGTITPATLAVENTTGNYVFQGTGLSGGTGLTKSGAGTLTLANNNTNTGSVSLLGGRLEVGNGGATGTLGGSGSIMTEIGTTLAFNTTSNLLIPASRPINGGAALEQNGTGTLEMQGTHLFSGGVNINAGTVLLSSNGGDSGVIGGVVNVASGATLAGSGTNAFGWGASRIHTLNINGGTVTTSANGDQGWAIAINMTGGTLTATGAGYYSLGGGSSLNSLGTSGTAVVSAPIRLRENNLDNALQISVADGSAPVDLLISGSVSETAAGRGIAKSGAGTLEISGTPSFTGTLNITDGTVSINRPTHSVLASALAGSGTLAHNSPQDLVLSGDGTNFAGVIDANGKPVRLASATAGAGTGGTIALEGGTLGLGLSTEGVLLYGTLGGAAMNTTPLTNVVLSDNTAGLHGGIGENTTIAYDGEIYLTAGQWSFGENVDDAVYVNIAGNTLINDNGWNTVTSGTFTAPADGWYSITLRVQNGGGGNGPGSTLGPPPRSASASSKAAPAPAWPTTCRSTSASSAPSAARSPRPVTTRWPVASPSAAAPPTRSTPVTAHWSSTA